MRFVALIISIGIATLPKFAQAQTDCAMPSVGEDRWPVATPESVGLASARLCEVVKLFDDWKQSNVHAVLVARHGILVFEHYFSGRDELWGQPVGEVAFGPETKHDERSVTKSITALVLGIAIDRGWIKGVDEPVLSFFPEYADLRTPEKDRITLRHLLTMSTGLEWRELGATSYSSEANSYYRMSRASDPCRFVLEQKVVAPPGQRRNYSSGSTVVLGAVLRKATGQAIDELARVLLFEPLGIADVEWYRNSQGSPNAATGLRLRPRDLAKIGQLVLQHGAWNGAQLVPAPWVDAATTRQTNDGRLSPSYGYQFWLERSLVHQREVRWSVALGLGGQRLYIAPALDLVVVVNAGLYKGELQVTVPKIIRDQYVLEALELP